MLKANYSPATSDFDRELKDRVSKYLDNLGTDHYRTRSQFILFYLLLSLISIYSSFFYFDYAFWQTVIVLLVLGVHLIMAGTSILHELTHQDIFKNNILNKAILAVFDCLLCFSTIQYKLRHLKVHHSLTNVGEFDYDLDTNGVVRLSPSFARRPIHRYQKIYAFLLYPIGIVHIAWIEDFKRFFTSSVGVQKHEAWKKADWIWLFVSKGIHFILFLYLPAKHFGWSSVLASYFFVFFICGLGISLIFQVSHVNSKIMYFDKTPQDGVLDLPFSWYSHQLRTTANYGTKSFITLLFTGGVNFQVEHHMFPNLSYWHLPAINKIVKELSVKHNHPYFEFSTWFRAVQDHYFTLDKLGGDDS